MLAILSLIFTSLVFGQSFQEKPNVPVFTQNNQRQVRVDCWGLDQDGMSSFFLPATQNPEVFSKVVSGVNSTQSFELTVSTLRSENTLFIKVNPENGPKTTVQTYGVECGYTKADINLYCSVFRGELEDL